MIDQYIPWLPYRLIGLAVVALILLVGTIVLALLVIGCALWLWIRFWEKLSNRMYRGYDVTDKEDRPPVWKVRIAGVALALSRFQFRKIPPAYHEADSLTDNDTSLVMYLRTVFYPEYYAD